MDNSGSITVGYWSTKGLGSVCRQIVLYSGNKLKAKNYKLQPIVKDNIITYDASEWAENDKIDLKKRNSLINLPYIELIDSSGNELLISQSNACLSYLGRKFKMFGVNEIEQIQCEQLLLETSDLRNIITSFAYTHFKNKDLEFEQLVDYPWFKFIHNKSAIQRTNVADLNSYLMPIKLNNKIIVGSQRLHRVWHYLDKNMMEELNLVEFSKPSFF